MNKDKLKEITFYQRPKNKQNNIAAIFPNKYEIGLVNLGFQGLIRFLEDPAYLDYSGTHKGTGVSRFFFDPGDKKKVFSPDTMLPLSRFKYIIVSISSEPDAYNLFLMLQQSGIPVIKSHRNEKDCRIIIGGAAVMINPEFWTPVADFIFLGSLESGLDELASIITEDKSASSGNDTGQIIKNPVSCNPIVPFSSYIVSESTHFGRLFLVEITRSCPYSCAFCSMRKIYGKFFSFSADRILSIIHDVKDQINHVGLVSALTSEHEDLLLLIEKINQYNLRVNLASLRVDSVTDQMIDIIKKNQQKSITIAPESGSDTIRKKIGKNFTNSEILNLADKLYHSGVNNIKLYFILGLPYDYDETGSIINLARQIQKSGKNIAAKLKYQPKITLSLAPLLPGPLTRLSHIKVLPLREVKQKITQVKRECERDGIAVESENLSYYNIHYAVAHGNNLTAIILDNEIQQNKSLKKIGETLLTGMLNADR